jgi:hypothetical protein
MTLPLKSKYKAVRTKVGGKTFASKKEAERYKKLLALQKRRKISDLECQKEFILQEKFTVPGTKEKVRKVSYICDFYYYDHDDEAYIVEDVKGMKTDVYRLKKKLFLRTYGDTYLLREV